MRCPLKTQLKAKRTKRKRDELTSPTIKVLFETPGGYSLFKLRDAGVLAKAGKGKIDLRRELAEDAASVVQLVSFNKFRDATEALAAATALVESKLDKALTKFLKANVKEGDRLLVSDTKLGAAIKAKLSIDCVGVSEGSSDDDGNANAYAELLRGVRENLTNLVPGLGAAELNQMALGVAHSLSRYKLRFSPDKVDTMIVQAINLLDDIDKEVNTYGMRVKEWYGWHFPEMTKIVSDNIQYARIVQRVGMRPNLKEADLSDILEDEAVEKALKSAALNSMGTDISAEDLANISALCEQTVELAAYRAQLYDYLKNRMQAIAPNLTIMVGELVGARLIAHAGSLLNLAKAPASTVQILGAEKALFRALKTKHDTPKYGLLYHASLIGQATPKNKGKVARVLAAKASLAIRVDAFGDETEATVALECRQKVEARLRQLETGEPYKLVPVAAAAAASSSSSSAAATTTAHDMEADATDAAEKKAASKSKKRKAEDGENGADAAAGADADADADASEKPKKKKKKDRPAVVDEE